MLRKIPRLMKKNSPIVFCWLAATRHVPNDRYRGEDKAPDSPPSKDKTISCCLKCCVTCTFSTHDPLNGRPYAAEKANGLPKHNISRLGTYAIADGTSYRIKSTARLVSVIVDCGFNVRHAHALRVVLRSLLGVSKYLISFLQLNKTLLCII